MFKIEQHLLYYLLSPEFRNRALSSFYNKSYSAMEMKQSFTLFPVVLLLFIHLSITLAQSPAAAPASGPPPPTIAAAPALVPPPPTIAAAPALVPPPPTNAAAPAPGPPPPTNVTKILAKAGHFSTFIRLLKATQTDARINMQLNNSNNGMTILAPSDNAFSNLTSITLNSLTDQQQSELIQFHILPSYFSLQQFQTASDPLSTEAGGTNYGEFPLNVTTTETSVNITTGFANASIASIVYTDDQLAVYEVDQVLLPQRFFIAPPPVPAPAPAPPKPKKRAPLKSENIATSEATHLMSTMFQASYVIMVLAAYSLIV